MSPLKKIKEGITSGNWSAVTDGYNQLTGENLDAPEVPEQDPRTNPAILNQIKELLESTKKPVVKSIVKPTVKPSTKSPAKKTSAKTTTKVVDKSKVRTAKAAESKMKNGKIDEKDIPVIGPSTSPRGEVNAKGRQMQFPTDQFFDSTEARTNSKKQVEKISREAYKPFMKECTECHKAFDFNKAYPAGKLDSKTDIYLCETCQTNKRT